MPWSKMVVQILLSTGVMACELYSMLGQTKTFLRYLLLKEKKNKNKGRVAFLHSLFQ